MLGIRSKNKGFTLIELMIVVAIIGILAVVALPNFVAYRNRSKISSCVATCEAIRTALATYTVDSESNLYPIGKWGDGAAGWGELRSFLVPLGTSLKYTMLDQSFANFIYRTVEIAGQDGSEYYFVFQVSGTPQTQTGTIIEVRNDGIFRWSGSMP